MRWHKNKLIGKNFQVVDIGKMLVKCVVCGIEYDYPGLDCLMPCPNGHTLQEQIDVADKEIQQTEVPNSSQG